MSASANTRERVERILKSASTPRSVAQLSGQIGVRPGNVRRALQQLRDDGRVEMTGPTDFLGDDKNAKGWRLVRARKDGGR